MGYAECKINMESRMGSASSGLRCSPNMRGQTLKSSSFCPHPTSRLAQSIVKDHMVSHYKKVYSAKAVIDASVPKSLIHSVKYNDQIRQEQFRKGGRPQSAHSLSQRSSRASCSSAQSRLSVQYDDSPYLCTRSSTVSSPRFITSFHTKERVHPSCKVSSQNQFHHVRPVSEIKYWSPEVASHRKQSECSLAVSENLSCYKSFQDPAQKTYSGDLLKKHSQHFTQEKPFTPKTLKSDKSSYLSNYRYYRAPRRKPTQDCTQSRVMKQETNHGSSKNKKDTQEIYEPSQGFNTEHGWSEDEFNGTYIPASRQQSSQVNKSRDCFFFSSSSRISPECGKSPILKNVSAEEEELMYLEFISAVTEDILSRGHISDRVLDRVTQRHIDINRHQLDECKMRHLLEVLRKDLEEPTNISTCITDLEKNENGLVDAFLLHLKSGGKKLETKENNDLFPYASLIKHCDSPDYTDPVFVSTPLCSPEKTSSPTETNEKDIVDDSLKGISSLWLGECLSSNTGLSEEDCHQNQIDTTAINKVSNESHEYACITSDKGFHQEQAEGCFDGQSKELKDLGSSLTELLHLSSNTHHKNVEATEQHTAASVTDDEF